MPKTRKLKSGAVARKKVKKKQLTTLDVVKAVDLLGAQIEGFSEDIEDVLFRVDKLEWASSDPDPDDDDDEETFSDEFPWQYKEIPKRRNERRKKGTKRYEVYYDDPEDEGRVSFECKSIAAAKDFCDYLNEMIDDSIPRISEYGNE